MSNKLHKYKKPQQSVQTEMHQMIFSSIGPVGLLAEP